MADGSLLCEAPECALRARCRAGGAAAFLVLGARGTRVSWVPPLPAGEPEPVDGERPARIAAAAREGGYRTVSLVGVCRDDLPDGGAPWLRRAVAEVRRAAPGARIELHAGDFEGLARSLREALSSRPDVFHHPLLTAPRLLAKVAPGWDYVRSLECLRLAREEFDRIRLRSTVLYGAGESKDDLVASIADLKSVRCEEVLFAPAPPALRRATVTPEALEKVLAVARKLRFERVEVVSELRACLAPIETPPATPRRKARG